VFVRAARSVGSSALAIRVALGDAAPDNDIGGDTMRRRILRVMGTLALAAAAPVARAQAAWPSKPIRIVSPSAPGGLTDVVARLIAERLGPALGQSAIVENRPGGTGALALDLVAKSPPDGHTLVVGFAGANVIYPLLNPKLPFDAQKDFTPIVRVSSGGNVLMVVDAHPARTLQQFVAWAKAQPQPPNYGSWGNGSGGHLAGEYLKMLTGIRMNHVPYRSASALGTDMAGGHMAVGFLDGTNALAGLRTGKLRALAQTGPQRAAGLPDVPTMLEQGVQFGVGVWAGILGPAGMPAPIVDRLNAEITKILVAPDLRDKWIALLGNTTSPTTPAEFAQVIDEDFRIWRKVIAEGGITLE
jgi:tripartite-type tricarboxylate transporter receptor subunit TctC